VHYFATLKMTKGKKTYTVLQLCSAFLMILCLMCLTVSTPFVYSSQLEQEKGHKSSPAEMPLAGTEEEAPGPLTNSAEEKTPKSLNSFSEEYLHDHFKTGYLFSAALQYHKNKNAGIYIAFHAELHVPPPNEL